MVAALIAEAAASRRVDRAGRRVDIVSGALRRFHVARYLVLVGIVAAARAGVSVIAVRAGL